MNFKILGLTDHKWDNYINSSYIYDFHHTSCFHKIEIGKKDEALLFVAEADNEFVAIPLIIKAIPSTKYFDATSVYGYCGPISSKKFSQIPENLISYFQNKFKEYCNNNNIISVFSRLHPLIEYDRFFTEFGNHIDLNYTVNIDLNLPLEEQRKAYRKSNKLNVNQLVKKKGYTVELIKPDDKNSINEFVNIYYENMKRVKAKNYYFFNIEYFYKLINNSCFKSNLLVARKQDNTMVAGAIFTETKTILQYHLAATKDEYLRDTPLTLILDKARHLGTEKGLDFLHLGGGLGGSDDDSLFRFKSGFSKNFFQFSVWNLIVNQKVYNELINRKNLQNKQTQFFPKYRAND